MWQLMPGQRLRLRDYGDESVLYNDHSGDTHLLGGSAAYLLELLADGPRTETALLAELGNAVDAGSDGVETEARALLAQLAGLFLIQAC